MKKKTNTTFKIIFIMILFIFTAIFVEMNILGAANKKQVYKTSQILLDGIENILINNEKNELEILEELKEDNIAKAKIVAHILNINNDFQSDITKLKKLAELIKIDQICLFDDKGYLYGGTQPEYYGLTFDSGEQISFFKPMMEDRNLSLCQDITPNTATAQNMMYATVWDPTKTYIVQVGVKPIRLINTFKKNTIYSVVNQIPSYTGKNIYIADIDNGEILGSSDKDSIGKTVYDIGILNRTDDFNSIQSKSVHINGFRNYCHFRKYNNYLIAVVHSTTANLESFLISIGVVILWILITGSIIIFTLFKLVNANQKIRSHVSLLKSISEIYYSLHLIDLSDLSIQQLEGTNFMKQILKSGKNAQDVLKNVVCKTIQKEYIENVLEFSNFETLRDRLKDRKSIFMDAIDDRVGWLRISFIKVEVDKNDFPLKVIIATQIIDEDKKREQELILKANRDELTGLLNRSSYENKILNYSSTFIEENFVYAAVDINGLKTVNDELGHAAGDELIKGVADCLKTTIGKYGDIYRTGGDEFVAIFYANDLKLQNLIDDLEKATKNWKGNLVDSLTLSVGYVTKQEFQNESIIEIAKIADKRMYQAKSEYYSRKGVDRRGQAAAHKALCNLYTKILKINLTDDSFTIVNMDITEQTADKGFANTISEWLYSFGKFGYVHPDDLEEYLEKTNINYLKNYFSQNNKPMNIVYRRKYGNEYKKVLLEMIPADDYAEDKQSLFLYVKSIEG